MKRDSKTAKQRLGERRARRIWEAVGRDPQRFELMVQLAELMAPRRTSERGAR